MQREIVADLIIVTVIMNEENDLNFAQIELNKGSVVQLSKENKENIVKQVAAWITTNLRDSDLFSPSVKSFATCTLIGFLLS